MTAAVIDSWARNGWSPIAGSGLIYLISLHIRVAIVSHMTRVSTLIHSDLSSLATDFASARAAFPTSRPRDSKHRVGNSLQLTNIMEQVNIWEWNVFVPIQWSLILALGDPIQTYYSRQILN